MRTPNSARQLWQVIRGSWPRSLAAATTAGAALFVTSLMLSLLVAPAGPQRPVAQAVRPSGLPASSTAAARLVATTPASAPFERLIDFSFVSDTEGWVLGRVRCGTRLCSQLKHTTDGGTTWQLVRVPNLLTGNPGFVCSACERVRFADSRVGYLYSTAGEVTGATPGFITVDAGRTWQHLPGQTWQLEVRNGNALRVANIGTSYTFFEIESAAQGSRSWTEVEQPPRPNPSHWTDALLARTGHRVIAAYLQTRPTGGNGPQQASLFLSGDDGVSWSTRSDPCGFPGGDEADTDDVTGAADGSFTVLCHQRYRRTTFTITSTDGGWNFGPATAAITRTSSTAASNRTTVLAAATSAKSGALYRNSGASGWSRVAAVAQDDGATSDVLGFEDARFGRWIPAGSRSIFMTADGGRHWMEQHP